MLDLSLEWNRPCRPLAGSQTLYLAVRLRPPSSGRPQPLNLVICLDVSTSMKGDRLASARGALLALWRALADGDRVSILAFGSVVQPVLIGAVKGQVGDVQIIAVLRELVADGRTLLAPALEAALAQLLAEPLERPSFLWVVSDGEPTCPAGMPLQDHATLWEAAGRARAAGITLGTVALGNANHFDARILFELAERGGGAFCYAREASELTAQLQHLLREARVVSATQGILRLNPVAGVRLLAVHRVVPDQAALPIAPEAPEVLVGAVAAPESIFLLELAHAPALGSSPGMVELATLTFEARFGGINWRSPEQRIRLELVASPSDRLLEANHAVETLRIEMELARNAERRLRASTAEEKLSATQDLLEWGRRSQNLALVSDLEQEAKLLRERGQLSRDQELQRLLALRGQEPPHA